MAPQRDEDLVCPGEGLTLTSRGRAGGSSSQAPEAGVQAAEPVPCVAGRRAWARHRPPPGLGAPPAGPPGMSPRDTTRRVCARTTADRGPIARDRSMFCPRVTRNVSLGHAVTRIDRADRHLVEFVHPVTSDAGSRAVARPRSRSRSPGRRDRTVAQSRRRTAAQPRAEPGPCGRVRPRQAGAGARQSGMESLRPHVCWVWP